MPDRLGSAQILHCSPSHHFPTGLVTPAARRRALLEWAEAAPERYIIEDDYDSEFRFHAHPVPALLSMDRTGRVIYMNTFSKTLAPSIRISYMVLPPALMDQFREKLGFYSCTVPSFEQYTLARFLSGGWFEKHINRMRKFYRTRRNRVIELLENSPFAEKITILEQDAGLHFLLRVDSPRSGPELAALCAEAGIRVRCLEDYYEGRVPGWAEKCLVINYSGLQEDTLAQVLDRLGSLVTES
jgi:GntR family transcriptional regulator/MocR family aminotransferase